MAASRKKILYVDDDESTLNVVSKFLISKNFKVLTSTTPFVAPILEEEKPDLLILDISMPLLSGDRLADILFQQGYAKTTPILFFSGEPREKVERISGRLPDSTYVTKESGLEVLLAEIRRILV